jgi:hypothetical protein
MANLASSTCRWFRSLLDTAAADFIGPKPLIASDRIAPDPSTLGSSAENDAAPALNLMACEAAVRAAFSKSSATVLGPCVGDD